MATGLSDTEYDLWHPSHVPRSDLCQVIDVSSQKQCSNLKSYPLSVSNAAGGVLNNIPTICGGDTGTSYKRYVFSIAKKT